MFTKRRFPKPLRALTAHEREALVASLASRRERKVTPAERAASLAELEKYLSGFTSEQIARALRRELHY